jgi:hypothetical protein
VRVRGECRCGKQHGKRDHGEAEGMSHH